MMKIWYLEPTTSTSLMLWRMETNKFRVVQYDTTAPLLTNVDYVMMDKKYKSIFEGMVGQVETQDVVVYDKVRNLTWDNYFEIKILKDIHPDSIKLVDPRGRKIWTYGNMAVFVSDELKTEIQNIVPGEFEFSDGFSHFA